MDENVCGRFQERERHTRALRLLSLKGALLHHQVISLQNCHWTKIVIVTSHVGVFTYMYADMYQNTSLPSGRLQLVT